MTKTATASASHVAAKRKAADEATAAAAAADEAAIAAAALVVSCEDAIRTGQDRKSTAADLAQKRDHAEWAQLRAEAARAEAVAARAAADELVHEAAIVEARQILADNSPEQLAAVYASTVDAVVEFVDAYQARVDALQNAARVLSSGNVDFDNAPVRSFEGTPLELQITEFVSSVLDIVEHAHERFRDPRGLATHDLQWVVDRIDNRGEKSQVRTIAENEGASQ